MQLTVQQERHSPFFVADSFSTIRSDSPVAVIDGQQLSTSSAKEEWC